MIDQASGAQIRDQGKRNASRRETDANEIPIIFGSSPEGRIGGFGVISFGCGQSRFRVRVIGEGNARGKVGGTLPFFHRRGTFAAQRA
jgi:hypothetical protein